MEQIKTKDTKTTYKLFILVAMSTAILLVSPVLILTVLGFYLDKFFHTTPTILIIGGILGFISGIHNVFRMMQLMQRRKAKVRTEK